MKVVSPDKLRNRKVLLRLDLDVPIEDGQILDDVRLRAGFETLCMCLENARSTIICGHIGRPEGKEEPKLSVKPVVVWVEQMLEGVELPPHSLHVLENLRFEPGEEECSIEFAKELASYGEVFINEAFASHHPSSSTTTITKLLPSYAGLRFVFEVDSILSIRKTPKKPLVAIIGGAKVEDKYQAIVGLAKVVDYVLVGGLLPELIRKQGLKIPDNVYLGELGASKIDISIETVDKFLKIIRQAKQIVWAGPMGKYEDPEGNKGNLLLAHGVISSGAESLIGGGDTITALEPLIHKFNFVSTGGGAMLELLVKGTLPAIEALE